MTTFVSRENEAGNGRQFYCRKEKSLGVLCTNFLRLYSKDGVGSIGLDDAASRLGVERRRIYDVVNILESVGVVARKQKNQYSWKGFEAIPHALEVLKEDALKENFGASTPCIPVKALDENESGGSVSAKTDGQEASSKYENKREKSLWLLTQNFVKLFLCSDADLITLDSAALALLGDSHNSTAMRTKVRRLYDIANVFSSMNLIEKTHHPESRKPAFRWLGWRGKPNNDSVAAMPFEESKKRSFGTDVTNNMMKRNRVDSSLYWKPNQKGTLVRHQDLENGQSDTKLNLQAKPNSRSFEFGPFGPVGLPEIDNSPSKRSVNRIRNLENLASTYHPHYRNQALSDLFGHYMEAWKSWYVEFADRENRQK